MHISRFDSRGIWYVSDNFATDFDNQSFDHRAARAIPPTRRRHTSTTWAARPT